MRNPYKIEYETPEGTDTFYRVLEWRNENGMTSFTFETINGEEEGACVPTQRIITIKEM